MNRRDRPRSRSLAPALLCAATLALAPVAPVAQETSTAWIADGEPGSFAHEFASRLYHGSVAEARRFAADSADEAGETARFAEGTALFLQAVQTLIGDLHRHGLLNRPGLDIPFLRLPQPPNPAPEPIDYAAFRDILAGFTGHLAVAEAVLRTVGDDAGVLPIRPHLVRIDIDGDGQAKADERLELILVTVLEGGALDDDPPSWSEIEAYWQNFEERRGTADGPYRERLETLYPVFGFDAADALWLAGYCNLLSSMAEILLAHDFEASFNQSFHIFFPDGALPFAVLNTMTEDPKEVGQAGTRRDDALIVDLLAFLVHSPWTPTEPERLSSARRHLLEMIALSRRSWQRIEAETDNLVADGPATTWREWIPSPRQHQDWWMIEEYRWTGGQPEVTDRRPAVTDEIVTAWRDFLGEFEKILDGKLLLPHWRFGQGVNLRRMLEEPRPISPFLVLQGSGALPYLEDGPVADSAHMEEIMNVLGGDYGGDFMGYAVWFN